MSVQAQEQEMQKNIIEQAINELNEKFDTDADKTPEQKAQKKHCARLRSNRKKHHCIKSNGEDSKIESAFKLKTVV